MSDQTPSAKETRAGSRDLTTGNESVKIVAFVLPMLLGNIFQQFYNMVDSFVVGRFVGTQALAAVGTSFPVIFLLLSLVMGVTMGASIVISQYFGAKNHAKVRASVDTAYIFLFWASIALTVIGMILAGPILKLLGVPADIFPDAKTYLQIIFAGMITTFGYNAISGVLRGIGDSRTPLYLLIVSTILNIILDLTFVVAFGWGVAGVAWATVISQAVSFIGGIMYVNRTNEYLALDIKKLKFDREIFAVQLKLGLPNGLQQTLVSIGMMAMTRIVNGFGPVVMAGFAAAGRLDSFAMMPAMNLSQAITTFTGQNIGAGKVERVKRGHRAAMLMNLGISGATSLLMVVAGPALVGIFTTDVAVIEAGSKYLTIVGLFYLLFGIMFINNGVVRGAGEPYVPMASTLLALYVVRIPCAILFSGPLGMGAEGIWWSIPAGWAMGCVFSSWYYLSGKWKNKGLVRSAKAKTGI